MAVAGDSGGVRASLGAEGGACLPSVLGVRLGAGPTLAVQGDSWSPVCPSRRQITS